MKRWLAKYRAWRSRQGTLEHLARVRAEGQTRYIIQNTLIVGLALMFLYDLFGSLDAGIMVRLHLTAVFIAWSNWRSIEKNYQRALKEAQQKAAAIPAPTNILGLRDS
jgi:hypothetical protein